LTEVVEEALRWLNGLGVDLRRHDAQGRNWLQDRFAAQQANLTELRDRFEQGCIEVRQAFRTLAAIDQAQGKNARKFLQRVKDDIANIEARLARLDFEASSETAREFDVLASYLKA